MLIDNTHSIIQTDTDPEPDNDKMINTTLEPKEPKKPQLDYEEEKRVDIIMQQFFEKLKSNNEWQE